ncbi:filamentous hemagglutinin N-terminal domain-containing protein [Desulfovibrio sp. OttesenSCG-928-M16]|nr:filamentous hemagglutinin N-terminal domain-containing protein [Desulfovibrio sp. OttesenSCG-928-M16]
MLKKIVILAVCFTLVFPINVLFAAPSGGQVVQGQADINQSGAKTTINQSSNRAIVNWQNFDIAKNESVLHNMPSASSAALHRVIGGGGASQLAGELKSNGNIFLVNPAGVVIHKGARIDTGGFMATTHDIANEDFMQGNYLFNKPGHPGASIINQGNITVRDQGFAALVAPTVRNEGVIAARLGKVTLASGDAFKLDFYGDDLINFTVPESTVDGLHTTDGTPLGVENTGSIKAEGGVVLLSATQLDGVVASVVNNGGTVSAASAELKGGRIVFSGAGENVDVVNTGTVTASSDKGDGGTVRMVADAKVKVSGAVEAKGAKKGGQVDASGKKETLIAGATISTEGESLGLIRLGGEFQGGKTGADEKLKENFVGRFGAQEKLASTAALTVDSASSISAGNDGTLIAWSEGLTNLQGDLAGKYVESSGKILEFGAIPRVNGGIWLVDPDDIVISQDGLAGSTDSTKFSIAYLLEVLASKVLILQASNSLQFLADLTYHSAYNLYLTANKISLAEGVKIHCTASPTELDNQYAGVSLQTWGSSPGQILLERGASIIAGGAISINGDDSIDFGDNVQLTSSSSNISILSSGNQIKIGHGVTLTSKGHTGLQAADGVTIGSNFSLTAGGSVGFNTTLVSIGENAQLAATQYNGNEGRIEIVASAEIKTGRNIHLSAEAGSIISTSFLQSNFISDDLVYIPIPDGLDIMEIRSLDENNPAIVAHGVLHIENIDYKNSEFWPLILLGAGAIQASKLSLSALAPGENLPQFISDSEQQPAIIGLDPQWFNGYTPETWASNPDWPHTSVILASADGRVWPAPPSAPETEETEPVIEEPEPTEPGNPGPTEPQMPQVPENEADNLQELIRKMALEQGNDVYSNYVVVDKEAAMQVYKDLLQHDMVHSNKDGHIATITQSILNRLALAEDVNSSAFYRANNEFLHPDLLLTSVDRQLESIAQMLPTVSLGGNHSYATNLDDYILNYMQMILIDQGYTKNAENWNSGINAYIGDDQLLNAVVGKVDQKFDGLYASIPEIKIERVSSLAVIAAISETVGRVVGGNLSDSLQAIGIDPIAASHIIDGISQLYFLYEEISNAIDSPELPGVCDLLSAKEKQFSALKHTLSAVGENIKLLENASSVLELINDVISIVDNISGMNKVLGNKNALLAAGVPDNMVNLLTNVLAGNISASVVNIGSTVASMTTKNVGVTALASASSMVVDTISINTGRMLEVYEKNIAFQNQVEQQKSILAISKTHVEAQLLSLEYVNKMTVAAN